MMVVMVQQKQLLSIEQWFFAEMITTVPGGKVV